jgi:hypothetical protein
MPVRTEPEFEPRGLVSRPLRLPLDLCDWIMGPKEDTMVRSIAIVFAALLAGPRAQAAEGPRVLIGASLPLTGADANAARAYRMGYGPAPATDAGMSKQTAQTAALALALTLATISGGAHAAQPSRIGVSAVVVHSLRLQVAPRPVMLAAAAMPAGSVAGGSSVRTVAAPGGTFYVVGFDVGFNGAATPAEIALHVRSDDSTAGDVPAIRYHQGRGGAWNRAQYGVQVPSSAQPELRIGRGQAEGGEVGVFVAKGAPAKEVDIVVTVMADAAPAAMTF